MTARMQALQSATSVTQSGCAPVHVLTSKTPDQLPAITIGFQGLEGKILLFSFRAGKWPEEPAARARAISIIPVALRG
jgi:hypothetical protein